MKKIVNYKVSGEEWTKAKDEAFAKIVKKAKVDGLDKVKYLEVYLKRNMVQEILLAKLWKK
jgi:hypothetical protein